MATIVSRKKTYGTYDDKTGSAAASGYDSRAPGSSSSAATKAAQQSAATSSGFAVKPSYTTTPTTSAATPASGDCVASTMAGNVITARVIYGT